jgi:hypothetical protein
VRVCQGTDLGEGVGCEKVGGGDGGIVDFGYVDEVEYCVTSLAIVCSW